MLIYTQNMSKNFIHYFKSSLKNLLEATTNIVLFLPYFFSIPSLMRTLYFPWKNLVTKDRSVGFSFNRWASVVGFNLISSMIGFVMRSSIILFYFFFQSLFLLFLPFILVTYIFCIPFFYLFSSLQKSEEELKEEFRLKFIGSHLLDHANYNKVANWFEDFYQKYLHTTRWWKRKNLFSIPPL